MRLNTSYPQSMQKEIGKKFQNNNDVIGEVTDYGQS